MTTLVRPREGRLALDGLYEGVPDYLRRPLTRWLENVYTIRPDALAPVMDEAGLERLAALLRIDLRGTDGYGMLIGILAWADDDDERLLDVIHYTLQIPTRMPKMWNELEILLAYGSSTWQATEKGLLLLRAGLHSNVIRTLVPLTISDALLEEGLDLLEASL